MVSGEGAAFEAFVVSEHGAVLAFARAVSGSWSEAEDLVQEAFLATYQRWADLAAPSAFVRRVVANQSASSVRRAVRQRALLDRLRAAPTAATGDEGLADPGFWAEVAKLPDRQRHVVALHYLEDRSVADIASVLAIAEGTVKATLHAARRSLAAALRSPLEEEEEQRC